MMRLLKEEFEASDREELIQRGYINKLGIMYVAAQDFTLCNTFYEKEEIIQLKHLGIK
jgi:hypothetical protein